MTNKELTRRVAEMVSPICAESHVSLWDVTFEKEGRGYNLTVFIDRADGVEISDCETVSRALDPLLDAPEFDSLPPYTLTVSSAGLERPLIKPEHFQWALGKKVVLGFYQSIDGQNEQIGELLHYDSAQLTLRSGAEEKTFARSDIARVRLAFEV